ncbi:uroporphyrinogen-III C-methyltransferase [Tautonia plasticadhaerens]|uniref:uroporphyrinogen-III C-methyltransferase n=1 Tax=Tautonia plasticadhaerens TaxID=2527974 RepID=A0A518GWN0_9BACT|nr:uroporphyrinogen-III C-methyltransferase [Tautonia plasticadhaerens]QDV32962.1 Uroporphyrinogen-III C-methyltransferase [Tautonia plasticadhaerens]
MSLEEARRRSAEGPPVGLVTLVGAGPGDPGLLTRAGAEALGRADAVVYDQLVQSRLLDLARPGADRIFAGKSRGKCPVPQGEINALLVRLAREGKAVVRLKGGDPYVFGRGAEEAEYLHDAGVPFRIVPGVTAGVGATSYAGIPVTHREATSAVAFVTGHNEPGDPADRLDWPALARFPGTLVFYMGFRHLGSICSTLVGLGKPPGTPAALVCSGSTASQRTVSGRLADLPDRVENEGDRLGAPALLVVGDVVARRDRLRWFERLPLFGRVVLLIRPIGESDRSAADLERLGAEVLVAPTVQILPVGDAGPMDSAIARLDSFDWLVFTSGNGVSAFLDRIEALGRDLRALGHLKLAAIGPGTAEVLGRSRLRADLIPASFRSEGLAEALRPLVAGRRVLLARADRGRDLLREELGEVAEVEQVAAYRNADAEALPKTVVDRLERGEVDWITLTSSAIASRLHGLLPDRARQLVSSGSIRLASISPVTSEAARSLGWPVAAEASEHTWPGLVRALLDEASATKDAEGS